ncbi:MAG: glycoside hydrolase family 3 C-terminal domain-containing protein [Tannerella sp.]|jgi:beta-glucosidase|nr:glycoside hydrolase family 3 C-terminal domain-containing protein [Tannerella sp.]
MKNYLGVIGLCLLLTQFSGCTDSKKYEYPFQNPGLTAAERAADLVSRLTLEEKVAQMLNAAPAIERLGIPPYDWWNECLHGVARTEYLVTVYPQAIAMAAGWDREAMRMMADYTAEEGRAVYNTSSAKGDYSIYHGLTYWTPNINIFRDPRWGRGQETYGEDPFLTADLGKHFVLGLQGDNPRYLKAAACAKHFAVHSGPESNRHTFNAATTSYDLWDTYLPAFQALVEDAKVAGVMCAYNAFEGQPCCGSDKLMIDILRNDWKFTGYVTSDCGAINDFYNGHKTHPDAPSAAADAVIHGTDVDCGNEAYRGLVKAVEDNLITEAQIDVSLRRLFEIRFRLGLFDPADRNPFARTDSTALRKEAHRAHALKMSQQSIVMLKNDGLLPLKKETLKKIAFVGPNADNPEVQLGNYNGIPEKIHTPLNGLKDKLPDVEIVYERGCSYASYDMLTDLQIENLVEGDGFSVEFFNNTSLEGEPAYRGVAKKLLFGSFDNPVMPGVNLEDYSSRFEGTIQSPVTGEIEFNISFDDGYRFYVNGRLVSESWTSGAGRGTDVCKVSLAQGEKYRLKLEHVQYRRSARIGLEAIRRTPVDFRGTAEKVKDADVIIFAGGISPRLEGEEMRVDDPGFFGGDRTTILLPKVQTEMLQALKATGKPVVFVMMTGSAISMPWEAENINAIVNAWYGGEYAGKAIADVLLGDYNPSGHLPVTFYAGDSDLPDFEDYSMHNRTYKYFTGKALYPFGYGLSYTRFDYEWAEQPRKEYRADEIIRCAVNIRNTGEQDGDAVGQVYIAYPKDGRGLPLKELRTFERKTVAKGGSHLMQIAIPVEQLAKWDDAAGKQVVPAGTYTIYAGNHSDDEAAVATFDIK